MSLKKIIVLLALTSAIHAYHQAIPSHTIMINPAGDTKDTGRTIEDTFERTITMELTQALQKAIDILMPNSSVIITRSPGEIIYPLQNATFANRLNIDLFISIHCFHTTDKNSISLFQFSYGDTPTAKKYDLTFLPFDTAYVTSYEKTSTIGQALLKELKIQQKNTSFSLPGLYQFPFTPLIGIQAPALGIEIGITHKNQWQTLVEPIAYAIKAALEIV